jgi:hypothetical protein
MAPSAELVHPACMLRSLLLLAVVLLVATFPATWMLMLFFGNLGVNLSYWGTLPLGILVSALLSGTGSQIYVAAPR